MCNQNIKTQNKQQIPSREDFQEARKCWKRVVGTLSVPFSLLLCTLEIIHVTKDVPWRKRGGGLSDSCTHFSLYPFVLKNIRLALLDCAVLGLCSLWLRSHPVVLMFERHFCCFSSVLWRVLVSAVDSLHTQNCPSGRFDFIYERQLIAL